MPGKLNFKSSHFGNQKSLIPNLKLKTAAGVLSRLVSGFFLKSRISGLLVKKVFKSCLKMSQTLLNWNTGNLIQPNIFRKLFKFSQSGAGLVVVHALSILKSLGSFSQKTVVYKTSTTKGLRQNLPLLFSWITSEIPSQFHVYKLQYILVNVNKIFILSGCDFFFQSIERINQCQSGIYQLII